MQEIEESTAKRRCAMRRMKFKTERRCDWIVEHISMQLTSQQVGTKNNCEKLKWNQQKKNAKSFFRTCWWDEKKSMHVRNQDFRVYLFSDDEYTRTKVAESMEKNQPIEKKLLTINARAYAFSRSFRSNSKKRRWNKICEINAQYFASFQCGSYVWRIWKWPFFFYFVAYFLVKLIHFFVHFLAMWSTTPSTSFASSFIVTLIVCTLLEICTWNIWKSVHSIAPESFWYFIYSLIFALPWI